MGSLQKELAKANVPLFLMSADKDIGVILKESTNIDFPTIDCPDDLEYLLDQSESGFNIPSFTLISLLIAPNAFALYFLRFYSQLVLLFE